MVLKTLLSLLLPVVFVGTSSSALAQQFLSPSVRSTPAVSPVSLRHELHELETRWHTICSELDGKPSISLRAALRFGLAHNPILSQNYAEIASSLSSTSAIRLEWYPSLFFTQPNNAPWDLAIATQTSNQSASGSATSYQSLQQLYSSPRLTLQWSFLDPTRAPRLNSQISTLRSRQFLFDISARNLVLDIQQSYYALQEAKELRSVYTEIYQLTKQQLARALQMRKQGMDTSGEISQIRTQLLEQLIQLIQLLQQELVAANALARVMSLPPGEVRIPSDPLQPVEPWTTPLQKTIDEALATREEIKNYLANASSLSWSSTALAQRYWPSMALLGQGQLTTNNQFQTTSGVQSASGTSSNATLSNSVGVNFNWLMVDGGILAAQSTALSQRSQAADFQASDMRYQVTQQVQDSYANYLTNNIVIDTAHEQVYTAKDAVFQTSRNYNGTTVNATTFNQTVRNYLTAVKSYKVSVRNLNIAVASLYRYSARFPAAVQSDLASENVNLVNP